MSLSAQPNNLKIQNTIDEQNENSETDNFNPDKEELRQKKSSYSSQSI